MYEGVDPPKNKVVPSGKDQPYLWIGLQTFDNYKKVRLSLYTWSDQDEDEDVR